MAFMDRVPHVELTPYAPHAIRRTADGYDVFGRAHQMRLDDLCEHYAASEDWWDIDPEDYEKLSDMEIVEDVLLLSNIKLGLIHAGKKYALHDESMAWLIKRFKQRVKEGDAVALAIKKSIKAKLAGDGKHRLRKQLYNARRCEIQILNGVA